MIIVTQTNKQLRRSRIMKVLMTGNEAVARGVWEAGAQFASAYPGTPSTEIMECLAKFDKKDIYAECFLIGKLF